MSDTAASTAGQAATADRPLDIGPLALDVRGGSVRVTFVGVEVVRQIDCPIRDADWRTVPVVETGASQAVADRSASLDRRFRTGDGAVEGHLAVAATAGDTSATVTLDLTLAVRADVTVNRAGFVLLHPAAVAGTQLTVVHGNGTREATTFPSLISPGQPVFDITGLHHSVGGIDVAITMEGEVFEMEDQRNWTDASFKTYCRPLAWPRPFRLAAGDTIRQSIRIACSGAPTSAAASAGPTTVATMPAITLAHEAALADLPPPTRLADIRISSLLLRVDARAPDLSCPIDAPVTLEIVADTAEDIATVAEACARAGLRPVRVIALPRDYLASHQPEGPWPTPRPEDFLALTRGAFPDAEVGGGVLTNFTEFNRHPPDPATIDFATFGTTAIVHAADDRSVRETLEALPAVFASARALSGHRPIHLGLVSVAMRSNPYGAATASNPRGARVPMAIDDPRQRTRFAGAFAIGAAAEAARAGIASLAPAMAAGPIALGAGETHWPLRDAVAGLAAIAGQAVEIDGGPGGSVIIRTGDRTIAANLGAEPARISGHDLPSMDFVLLGGDT